MKLHENSEVFSELVAAAAERIGLPEIYVEKVAPEMTSEDVLAFPESEFKAQRTVSVNR